MPIRVDAYTVDGVASGVVARAGHLRDALDSAEPLVVENAGWLPLDGSSQQHPGEIALEVDDLVVVAPQEEIAGPVHAVWHEIDLDAGPYHIAGQLPTLPGFDPGRALTRPSGEFVLLQDVRIELLGRPAAGGASHRHALINRYSVDRVKADLMLGFFFPGAVMELTGEATLTAAGASAAKPSSPTPTAAAPASAGAPAPAPEPVAVPVVPSAPEAVPMASADSTPETGPEPETATPA